MRKTGKGMAAVLLAAGILLAASGCLGGGSSAGGQLSENSYDTAAAAAAAYVENEIAGDLVPVSQTGVYAKTADLSEEEIEELDLGFFTADSVTSAEEGSVVYVVEDGEYDDIVTESLIVLGINGRYRYYVGDPAEGDALTGTYLAGVTGADNATATVSGSAALSLSFGTDGGAGLALYEAYGWCRASVTGTWSYTLAVTADCMYLFEAATVTGRYYDAEGSEVFPDGTETAEETTETQAFGVRAGSGLRIYLWDEEASGWDTSCFLDCAFDNWGDYLYDTVLHGMDHTYFEKTSLGFEVPDDKTGACMLQILAGCGASFAEAEGTAAEGSYDCTGSNGNLTKIAADLTMTLEPSGAEDDTAEWEAEITFEESVGVASLGRTRLSAGSYGLEI